MPFFRHSKALEISEEEVPKSATDLDSEITEKETTESAECGPIENNDSSSIRSNLM